MSPRDGPTLWTKVVEVRGAFDDKKYEHEVWPRLLDARWAWRSEGPIAVVVNALWGLILVCTLLLLYGLIAYPNYSDDMKVENVHITGLHVALAASWLTWFVLLAVAFQFHGPWIPSSANDRRVFWNDAWRPLIPYHELTEAVNQAKYQSNYQSSDILKVVCAAAGLALELNGKGGFPTEEDFKLD